MHGAYRLHGGGAKMTETAIAQGERRVRRPQKVRGGPRKGYIRDGCALLGGELGLIAAIIKLAIDDRDWEWLFGTNGTRQERDFWLRMGSVESCRFEYLVTRALQ